jgi:hypothetical protein
VFRRVGRIGWWEKSQISHPSKGSDPGEVYRLWGVQGAERSGASRRVPANRRANVSVGFFNVDQNHLNRHGGKMALESFNVVHQLFSVGHPSGHLLLEGMTGYDCDANIGFAFIEEVLEPSHVISH